MHYLMFGAGAVGGYLGARLTLSGCQTTFLTRPRIIAAWKDHGLRLINKTRTDTLSHPTAVDHITQALIEAPPDVILLTVKTYDVEMAAEQIRTAFSHPIPIVCFTNGVGSEAKLACLLEGYPIIPATLTTAVRCSQDGVVFIERERGVGFAGSFPILSTITADFNSAGVVVGRYQNPQRMKWSKLLTNIVTNASSAILGWPPGSIFQHRDLYRIEVQAIREAVLVMRKMGIKPQNLPGVPVSLLSHGLFLPPWITREILGQSVSKGRGEKLPSFHYDIGRGKSEIHQLNGAVVAEGERVGLATPANRFLYNTMITLIENGNEHKIFHNQPGVFLKHAVKAGIPGIRGYNPESLNEVA